jgi:hypothetical protein
MESGTTMAGEAEGRAGSWAVAAPSITVLVVCLTLLGAAVALGRVATTAHGLRIGQLPLPSLCGFRTATGLPCPGCGLTRSWVDLARGDLGASVAHHRLGWLLMLYAVAQTVRHALWLLAPQLRTAVDSGGAWLDRGLVLLGAGLLGNWLLTLARLW